jgi:hypothetical protein
MATETVVKPEPTKTKNEIPDPSSWSNVSGTKLQERDFYSGTPKSGEVYSYREVAIQDGQSIKPSELTKLFGFNESDHVNAILAFENDRRKVTARSAGVVERKAKDPNQVDLALAILAAAQGKTLAEVKAMLGV